MPSRPASWLLAAVVLLTGLAGPAQGQQFFASDGSALDASKYSSSASGPFTNPFVNGGELDFGTPSGTAGSNGTGTGASITVSAIVATTNFTLTGTGGTISNAGNAVVPITVSSGVVLDFGTQAFSSSGTAGYIKNGDGVLVYGGGNFGGGFTLNSGSVILRSLNAFGSAAGNTLTLNGGIIAASTGRDYTGKLTGGIFINGDFQIGVSTSGTSLYDQANQNATFTFGDATGLQNGVRKITIGGNGNATLNGVISDKLGTGPGTGPGGLTVARNAGRAGTLIFGGANTFTGATTVLSGILSLSATGSVLFSPTITTSSGATFNVSAVTTAGVVGSYTVGGGSSAQTLQGEGTIIGPVTVSGTTGAVGKLKAGTLAVANPAGGNVIATSNGGAGTLIVSAGSVTFTSGSVFGVQIANSPGTAFTNPTPVTPGGSSATGPANNNLLSLTGSGAALVLPSTGLVVSIDGTGVMFDTSGNTTYSYKIAQAPTAITTPNSATFTTTGFTATNFALSTDTTGGTNNLYVQFTPTPAPEPATALALAAGTFGLGAFLRRRRSVPVAG